MVFGLAAFFGYGIYDMDKKVHENNLTNLKKVQKKIKFFKTISLQEVADIVMAELKKEEIKKYSRVLN